MVANRLLGSKLVNSLVTFSGTGYPLSCLLYPPRAPPSGARVNSFGDIAGTASEPGVNLYVTPRRGTKSLWSDIVLEFFCSPPRVRRLYCHSGRPGIVPVSASSPCRIFLVSPALLVSATSFSSSMLGRSTRRFLDISPKEFFRCRRSHVEFFSTSFAGPSFSSGPLSG